MKIEVWADLVCPYCYIGKRQLELALNELPFKQHVIIEYKSFEIYPKSEKTEQRTIEDLLCDRYNLTIEQTEEILIQAKKVNLSYKLDMLMHVDTFNVHRFLKYACTQNKANEVAERILKGYLINGEKINDYETLMKIGKEFSFNNAEIESILKSNKYSRAVKCDQIEANEIGIESVPFFVFNEKISIAGIQTVETFIEVLEITWENMGRKPQFSLNKNNRFKTSYCTGNHCDG